MTNKYICSKLRQEYLPALAVVCLYGYLVGNLTLHFFCREVLVEATDGRLYTAVTLYLFGEYESCL
jgi:hypothetical protein